MKFLVFIYNQTLPNFLYTKYTENDETFKTFLTNATIFTETVL
jgi:hypothetical protein